MTLRLVLFNQFQVTLGGQAPAAPLRPRALRLLAYLLLQRGQTLAREGVAFTLWPDSPEDESLGTLRRALSDLRAALPPPAGAEWVTATRGEIAWRPTAPYWLDVEAFER